ncbi:hypothetical protein [Streptomyces luteireticuli]|uniref:Transglycosylase SLT domain-containing protein n=1 Tax=Streptomyces luteireticuli TaxID=173858 RepID=A0ABP3ITA4_9ACTN
MAIVIGSVEVQIIPTVQGVRERLRAALSEPATKAGEEAGRLAGQAFSRSMAAGAGDGARVGTTLGRDIAAALAPAIRRAIPDAVRSGGTRARTSATRSGEETGGAFARSLRARLEAAFRSLPDITIGADTSETDAELSALRARLEALAGKTIGIDLDAVAARAEVEEIESELTRLGAAHPDVTVRADTAAARAQLAAVREEIDRISARPGLVRLETDGSFGARLRAQVQAAQAALPEINIVADTSPARAELMSLRAQLAALADVRIGIDLDAAAALARIDAVQARLAVLSASDAEIDVRVDAAAASAALTAVRAQVAALDGKSVNLDFSASILGTLALAAAFATLAASPALSVVTGQVAGLAAVLVTAATGAGLLAAVAIPAIGGIAQALQAKKAAEDAAATATDTGARAAAQAAQRAAQQEAAVRSLATAQRNGAEQVASAQRQVAQAEEGVRRAEEQLTRAQQDERRAQQALTQSRREAVRELEDLNNQLVDAALSERSATLRVAEAKRDLAKTSRDRKADALDRARAQLAYDEAVQRLKEQRAEHQRLAEETRRANKAGIEGTQAYQRAQEGVAQAHQRTVDQARAVADAQRRVADAVRGVAKAQRSAAEAVADAQRQVAASHQQVAQTTTGANTAATKYARALAALTPPARDLFDSFLRLRAAFKDWSASLQPDVLPLFTRALDGAGRSLPAFTPLVHSAASGVRDLMDATAADFRTPFWDRFRDDLARHLPVAVNGLGTALGYTVKGLAGMLDAALPHTESFTASLVAQAKRFSEWGDRLQGSQGFADFLARVRENGPLVAAFLGGIAAALGNIARAMQPMSAVTLVVFTDIARFVASVPPGVLEAIGVALITVSLGLKAAGLATVLLGGAVRALNLAAAAGPVGWIIAAVAALALAAIYAYNRFDWFRDGVNAAWDAIKTAALIAWTTVLQPTFTWIADLVMTRVVPAFMWLWNNALSPLFAWLAVQLPIVWETWVKPAFSWLADFIMTRVVPAVMWLWLNAIQPAMQAIGLIVETVWQGALQPALLAFWGFIKNTLGPIVVDFATTVVAPMFKAIGVVVETVWETVIWPALQALWSFIKNVVGPVIGWLYNYIVKPTFQLIGAAVKLAWDYVIQPAFEALGWFIKRVLGPAIEWLYYDMFKPLWRGLGEFIEWGWEHLIRPAFDALKTGIGYVAKAFEKSKDAVGEAWGKIKELTKDPVNFVLGTVWNNGVLKAWNKLTGWIPGIGDKLKMDKLPLLESGGSIPVRPGVFNRPTAIVGEGNPRWPEYVIPTDPKYRTRALGLLQAAGTQMLARGGVIGSTVGKAAGWGSGVLDSIWGGIKDGAEVLVNPSKIMDKLLKPVIGDLDGLDPAMWTQMLRHTFTAPVKGVKDMVVDYVKGLTGSGGTPQHGGDTGGSGVTRWTPQVLTALGLLGQPASWRDTVLRRMNQESGGNPTIVNLWDSNATSGTPSVGLMQVIGPTFDAYAGPFRNTGPFLYGTSVDPLANIYSGLNYAIHRYGSLSALDRPGGYDSGGYLPPGLSLVYNGLGTPEPVFTPTQWDAIKNAKSVNPEGKQGSSSGTGAVIHLHAVPGIPTEQQIVGALKFADALYAA